ncbi:ABC transporter ATP-binding protein [Elioraea sp.]|uniref:ABC transporter ATP-binding protein n=1 Tax=Elioraea sp. TaxID=2185103 RepID=UPI0025C5D3B1|nr:ABC transporter ATP-binding protein [Elioraea sp.]
MASITLDRVSKRFGGLTVVDAVSLDIADGEFMVLVGPSGCGKSTTLRMIAGLEESSEGRISIGARDVTRLEPRDRNVAMVFQNYALYPHKSVYDNLAFGLRMKKLDRADIERRVRRAAAMLGIEQLLARKPRQLSGGQMQRVALGRALVRDPEAFLLDEPLSNLDARMRVQTREEIAKLHREVGTSMVYVTHDQVEAMTLGDRVCAMRDGRIQQVGPPLALYDRPANRFVAAFIGSPEMNLVEADVVPGPTVHIGEAVLPLPEHGIRLPAPGSRITLGIRPEHLAVADGAGPRITGTIGMVERLGDRTLVGLDVAGIIIKALLPRDDALAPGQHIALAPMPGRLHVFDGETGASLAVP